TRKTREKKDLRIDVVREWHRAREHSGHVQPGRADERCAQRDDDEGDAADRHDGYASAQRSCRHRLTKGPPSPRLRRASAGSMPYSAATADGVRMSDGVPRASTRPLLSRTISVQTDAAKCRSCVDSKTVMPRSCRSFVTSAPISS